MTDRDEWAQRLRDAAARYRYDGDTLTALKLEAVLSRLDADRPVRVVDLEAAETLAAAVMDRPPGATLVVGRSEIPRPA